MQYSYIVSIKQDEEEDDEWEIDKERMVIQNNK